MKKPFALIAYEACVAKSEELNRRLSKDEWIATVQTAYDAFDHQKPKLSKDERSALFEALASATGVSMDEASKTMKAQIATHVAEIVEATPNVTPEEIMRRVASYKRKNPTWTLTPGSIAKWWGTLGSAPSHPASEPDSVGLPEPKGWRNWVRENSHLPENADKAWSDFDRASQNYITEQVKAKAAAMELEYHHV